MLHSFTCRELCYLLYGYHKAGFLPKPFAKLIESEIAKTLTETTDVELEEIQLMTKVFCKSRVGTREFHKLLETTILTRLEDIKRDGKILHSIGYEFELSGLCSIDTLKILKKTMF